MLVCISCLPERELHVGVSVEVVASHGLSHLPELGWGRRTHRLLPFWRHDLLRDTEIHKIEIFFKNLSNVCTVTKSANYHN